MSEENKFNAEEELENSASSDAGNTAEDIADSEDIVESSEEQAEAVEEITVEPQKTKKKRSVSLKTFIISAVAIILATLMLTYSVCAEVFRRQYLNSIVKGETVEKENTTLTDIDLLNAYIDEYFYGDVDKEAMLAAALKAYVAATGDVYAAYYTVDELLANYKANNKDWL